MSCQSLALNSPALHACSKHAGMLVGIELRPRPLVLRMATPAVTQVKSASQARCDYAPAYNGVHCVECLSG